MVGRLATSQDFILKNLALILVFCALSFIYTSNREIFQSLPEKTHSSSKAPSSKVTSKFSSKEDAASSAGVGISHKKEVDSPTSRPKSSPPDVGNGRRPFTASGAGAESRTRSPAAPKLVQPTEAPKNASAEFAPDVAKQEERTARAPRLSEGSSENEEEESVVIDIPEKKKYI
eukprot:symbB.v1.2.024034.t1/scaffold2247.1/size84628/7